MIRSTTPSWPAELGQLLAAAAGDERQRARRQPGRLDGLDRDPREHRVGVRRRRGAAQHHRVAGLQRQRRGVDRHVRPRLVDDGDDAERDAHLAHVEPVRQPEAVDHLADRVGQRGDLAHAGGHRGDAALVERQPVHQRARRARTRGRPRGRARWPRGSPACAPPARRRSRAAPRPWSPSWSRASPRAAALAARQMSVTEAGDEMAAMPRSLGPRAGSNLGEHEVVAVHGLLDRPREHLAHLRPTACPSPGAARRPSSCRSPCRSRRRRRARRPRPPRPRRRRRRRRRSRPAAATCRPRAAPAPRRRRRSRCRASAWRT